MKKNWFWYLLALIVLFILIKKCEQEPKTITKTVIEYIEKTDTITKTKIDTIFTPRYIVKTKTIKGKDSIIYVTTPDSTTIEAREYRTTLIADSSKADLKILTTGELLDVSGTITWTQKETTTTITKIKPKSGLFLYGETSIIPSVKRFELGLDYQIRNTVIIGTSASYSLLSKEPSINVKLGVRIF